MGLRILEKKSIRASALPITVEQYQRLGSLGLLPDHTELIEGVIIEKMTKSPLHSRTVQLLAKLIESLLPPGYHVRQ